MADARREVHTLSGADRDALLDAMTRSRELHGHWVTPPTTPAEFDELLRRAEEDMFVSLLVRLRADGRGGGLVLFSAGQAASRRPRRGPLQHLRDRPPRVPERVHRLRRGRGPGGAG